MHRYCGFHDVFSPHLVHCFTLTEQLHMHPASNHTILHFFCSHLRRAPGSGASMSFNTGSKSDSVGSSSGSFSDSSRTAHSQGKTPMRLASRSLTGHASVSMSSSLPAADPFALKDWCDPLLRKDNSNQQLASARIVEDLSEFAFDMDGTAQVEVPDEEAEPVSPGFVADPVILATFDDS